MDENEKIYKIKKIFVIFILSSVFFLICQSLIPYLFYDDTEVTNSTGNILIALKEVKVLEPDKLLEFDIHKKIRFVGTNTSMSFKFNYSGLDNEIQPYYIEQAKKKKWKVIKANDNEIVLEKKRDKNLVHLDFQKQKDSIWLLNASYTIIMK